MIMITVKRLGRGGRFIMAFAVSTMVLFSKVWASENKPNDYLLPQTVLASTALHFPKVLESLAERRAVKGDRIKAEGAFDLVFSADGFDRVNGFWTGGVVKTEIKKNLRPFGGAVYGGYRISDGRFPIYEDQYFTNEAGEFKIGGFFSLLKNRAIDERRFALTDAEYAAVQADLEVLLTRIGAQHKALSAYWRWVAAGRQLRVYEDLLRLAQAREEGLKRQVSQGAIAAIFLTENNQNIMRRQRLVGEARRDFLTASNNLSFYYRDGTGQPLLADLRRLPPMGVLEDIADLGVQASASNAPNQREKPGAEFSSVLMKRPELSIVRAGLERAQNRIDLSRNDLKPQLDAHAELSRDFGAIAEGGASRDSTDVIAGFRFSVPLQRRDAKGKLRRAQAEYDALTQRERQVRDQIEIQLRNVLVNLSMSQQLVLIADKEFEQANLLSEAEQKRFQSGASDFFLVNLREETAANARIGSLAADMEARLARTNYDAAIMDLNRLGLTFIEGQNY